MSRLGSMTILVTGILMTGSLATIIHQDHLYLQSHLQPVKTVKVVKVEVPVVLNSPEKVALFVNEMMEKRQAQCLLWIFYQESRLNPKAKNPHSSAKGIGQLLDSTYKNIGLKHSADPIAQVVASIAYISERYGSGGACSAKAFWQKHFYY